MKIGRFLSVMAAGVLLMAFAACGDDDDGGGKSSSKGGASSPEAAVKAVVDGINNRDVDKVLAAMYPADYIKAAEKDGGGTYPTMKEGLSSAYKLYDDNFGDDWKADVEITDKKEMSKDKLDDVNDELKDFYDEYSLEAPKVTDGYDVYYDMEIKGSDDSLTMSDEFEVFEIDGKWYAIDF